MNVTSVPHNSSTLKLKSIVMGLFASLLLMVPSISAAQDVIEKNEPSIETQTPTEGRFENKQLRKMKKMIKRLGLSAEQEEKVKALKVQSMGNMKNKRYAMRQAHQNLEQLMKSAASEAEVRAQYDLLEKLQTEFARTRFEHVLAIRAILTPEQREKFKGFEHDGKKRGHKRNRDE